MKTISQDEINDVAWRACDTFRGTIDPAQYKDYILVMLFLKYLSDVWKDKKEDFEKEFKGDTERVKRRLARERFIMPDGCDYYTLYAKRSEPNIGEIINVALEAIEDTNKAKLEGVFRNIDFNSEANLGQTKERNKRLKHLLEDFADDRLDLRPSRVGKQDIIGNTYQYLIGRFPSDAGKKGGEFYTPGEVSELLAKLLAPKKGSRIGDPACGSGSLLIQVADEVGGSDFSLYGQEMNGSTWALCRMNMLVHNKDSARIEWGDTLANPKLVEDDSLMKFDVVVANPPFSLDKWGAESAEADRFHRFHRGVPPRSKGDYAFISYRLKIVAGLAETVKLKGRFLCVATRRKRDASHVRALLESWYEGHTRLAFQRSLALCLAESIGEVKSSPRLRLRRIRKRWGSWTKRGGIYLNPDLILAPPSCIDYVVTHELCHLVHPHHGREFYALLRKKMPDWETRKARLESVATG